MPSRQPIPTLGFASQKAAVIALYERGYSPTLIAQEIGAPRNSVTRSIHEYRVKTGRMVPITHATDRKAALRSEPRSTGWRWRNYEKSVAGARKALEAMEQ